MAIFKKKTTYEETDFKGERTLAEWSTKSDLLPSHYRFKSHW